MIPLTVKNRFFYYEDYGRSVYDTVGINSLRDSERLGPRLLLVLVLEGHLNEDFNIFLAFFSHQELTKRKLSDSSLDYTPRLNTVQEKHPTVTLTHLYYPHCIPIQLVSVIQFPRERKSVARRQLSYRASCN